MIIIQLWYFELNYDNLFILRKVLIKHILYKCTVKRGGKYRKIISTSTMIKCATSSGNILKGITKHLNPIEHSISLKNENNLISLLKETKNVFINRNMNSDTYFKYFYYHTKHILKMKMHMKNFCKYIMGAGRSPANYGFGHLPDFENWAWNTLDIHEGKISGISQLFLFPG